MELERGLMDELIGYLKRHGYPDDSFAIEYNLARDCYVDLAIIDRTLNIPIMLFELKSIKNDHIIQMGIRHIRRCQAYLEDKDIPLYLIVPKDTEPFFEAFRANPPTPADNQNLNGQVKEDMNFGRFKYNKNTRLSKARENKVEKKHKMVDAFKWVCWSIAMLLIIIGFLMTVGVIIMTRNELYIFASAIVLIICPFVSSIKILGIEIKQLEDKVDI